MHYILDLFEIPRWLDKKKGNAMNEKFSPLI